MNHKIKFQIGEQPNWLNTEVAKIKNDAEFLKIILKEDLESLFRRNYFVFELDEETREMYDNFITGYQEFCNTSIENKIIYANTQFESAEHSPNQLHGYSEVDQLKTQFMLRDVGFLNADSKLKVELPKSIEKTGPIFFRRADLLCRTITKNVLRKYITDIDENYVDDLLDPIDSDGHLPKNYISSSILDNFHYLNKFDDEQSVNESNHHLNRFFNNHAAHTDSGLVTLVICTDSPGLEVLDPILNCWVSIETCIHKHAEIFGKSHRDFAIMFWSDSVCYLNEKISSNRDSKLVPCLHRVEKGEKGERFSVVFKQRTCPSKTPPRYQEDYILVTNQIRYFQERRRMKKRVIYCAGIFLICCLVL